MCSEKKTYKLYSSSPLYQPAVFHFILVMFLSEWFWLLLVIDTIRQVGGRSPVLSWTRNLGKQNEAGLPCGLAGYLFKNVLHVLSFFGYENESRPRHQKNGVCESLTLPSSRWLSHCHMPWKTPIVDLWVLEHVGWGFTPDLSIFGGFGACDTKGMAQAIAMAAIGNAPRLKTQHLILRCDVASISLKWRGTFCRCTFFAIIYGPIIS